jgi:hypothetical protein
MGSNDTRADRLWRVLRVALAAGAVLFTTGALLARPVQGAVAHCAPPPERHIGLVTAVTVHDMTCQAARKAIEHVHVYVGDKFRTPGFSCRVERSAQEFQIVHCTAGRHSFQFEQYA